MMNEERFDQLLDSLRDTPEAAPAEVKARVWEKLAVSAQTSEQAMASPACAQIRADLPAYAAGSLLESRRMLVDDHLSRCVECRKVLTQQSSSKVVEMPRLRTANRFQGWTKWAVAAGVAAVAIYAGRDRLDSAFAPGGARATVEMVAGELRGAGGIALAKGAQLNEGDVVRTGAGARAVLRLADGSALEMNQQATLAVHAAWSGQTVQLESGDVIIQAAKQRRGHLRVRTRDSVASVKGTIFAVSTGVAGSLVAVAEGSVEVEQGVTQALLKPGQRKASSDALASVEPSEAFAWSQNSAQYLALLADFAKIEATVAQAPQNSRREARLVSMLPAGPLVYGAIPNIGESLGSAVEGQLRQSASLRAWWESGAGKDVQKMLDTMNTVAPHLGEELVFVLAADSVPVMLAEVKAGQKATLEQSLAKLLAGTPGLSYRVTDRLLVASDSAAHLATALATAGQGAATPFAQEIAQRYQARGAGWMLAVNVEALPGTAMGSRDLGGTGNLRHAFFEQSAANGVDHNEAALTFSSARSGVASWLGAPAAAGSAEYVSSDAVLALSAVTKSPRLAFDEFVNMISKVQPDFVANLGKMEAEMGIRVGDDVAAALGSDFTVAIESATVPVPGWTLTAEVLRPSTLDSTVRRLVDLANQKIANPAERIVFAQDTANGRSWNSIKTSKATLYWTYDRGYLVASTDRAIALKAIQTRNGGFPLVRSAQFRGRLPLANTVHQSGFLWVNATPAMQLLASAVPALQTFAESRGPILVTLTGENDRIVAASRTRLTSLLVDLAMMSAPDSDGKPGARRLKKKQKADDDKAE